MGNEPLKPMEYESGETHERSPLTGAVLGFVGMVLMLFGLPLAVALPAGLIWGQRTDAVTVMALIGASAVGSVFVYAASLLIGAAIRAVFGGDRGPR